MVYSGAPSIMVLKFTFFVHSGQNVFFNRSGTGLLNLIKHALAGKYMFFVCLFVKVKHDGTVIALLFSGFSENVRLPCFTGCFFMTGLLFNGYALYHYLNIFPRKTLPYRDMKTVNCRTSGRLRHSVRFEVFEWNAERFATAGNVSKNFVFYD